MSPTDNASADKKRKTAVGAATSASSGAAVGPFGSAAAASGSSAGALAAWVSVAGRVCFYKPTIWPTVAETDLPVGTHVLLYLSGPPTGGASAHLWVLRFAEHALPRAASRA